MVDSLDSGSSVHCGRAGSSPASRTKKTAILERGSPFLLVRHQDYLHIRQHFVLPPSPVKEKALIAFGVIDPHPSALWADTFSCCGARCAPRQRCAFVAHRPLPLAHLASSATGSARFAPPGEGFARCNGGRIISTSVSTSCCHLLLSRRRLGRWRMEGCGLGGFLLHYIIIHIMRETKYETLPMSLGIWRAKGEERQK